jgi:drug/metabolite transporter (DMT)-like permease
VSGYLGIAVADTWYLRALHLMGASRTGLVASLLSPFVILLSVLFLGESLRGWQLVGFALVMAGILLVTWRSRRRAVDAEHVRRGVMYGVGAMFLMAVGIVMVKEILETRSFLWTTEIRLAGGISGMLVCTAAALGDHYPGQFSRRLRLNDDVAGRVQADPCIRGFDPQ